MIREVKSLQRHRLESENTGPSYDGDIKLATLCSKPRQTVCMNSIPQSEGSSRVRNECTCTMNHIRNSALTHTIDGEISSSTRLPLTMGRHEANSSVASSDMRHNSLSAGTSIENESRILSDLWNIYDDNLSIENTNYTNICTDVNKDIDGGTLQCNKAWKSEEEVISINPILNELTLKVIIDSGATNHMFPDIDVFYEWEEFDEPRYVYFGDGRRVLITGIGHTCLVKNALYIPELANGIISISKLDIYGYDIRIRDGKLRVLNQSEEVVMHGSLENDLYELGRLYKQMLVRPVCDGLYETGINEEVK